MKNHCTNIPMDTIIYIMKSVYQINTAGKNDKEKNQGSGNLCKMEATDENGERKKSYL